MTSNIISGNQSFTSNGNQKSKTSWELTRASVDSLAKSIESGHPEALSTYLGVMARFHTLSAKNCLLIAAQFPNASHLEGIRSWNELGRFVHPGEKGIYIFAPILAVKNHNQPHPAGHAKKTKGKRSPEPTPEPAQPETQLLGYRGVFVFDIGQTGGEQLPESRKSLDVPQTLERLTAFATAQGMTIEYADWLGSKKATSYRGAIRLLSGMEPAETLPLLLHEVASQVLYSIARRTFVTRAIREQETKAVAFVVCEALGLENKDSFADCQLYYGDSRLLGESLEIVHRAASTILKAISPDLATAANSTQGVN